VARAPVPRVHGGDRPLRIGVTRQTVIAIEQGRYSPSLEVAFKIARTFGVGLDDVFQYPNEDRS
jgi:putative transcriptional regulator